MLRFRGPNLELWTTQEGYVWFFPAEAWSKRPIVGTQSPIGLETAYTWLSSSYNPDVPEYNDYRVLIAREWPDWILFEPQTMLAEGVGNYSFDRPSFTGRLAQLFSADWLTDFRFTVDLKDVSCDNVPQSAAQLLRPQRSATSIERLAYVRSREEALLGEYEYDEGEFEARATHFMVGGLPLTEGRPIVGHVTSIQLVLEVYNASRGISLKTQATRNRGSI